MLQGVHERKISEPVEATGADFVVVAGAADRWIYVHELIGDLDAAGILTIKAGTRVLAVFDLDAGQGITENDEPGEDNRPRFECFPGEDFILDLSAGTFIGSIHYSFGY